MVFSFLLTIQLKAFHGRQILMNKFKAIKCIYGEQMLVTINNTCYCRMDLKSKAKFCAIKITSTEENSKVSAWSSIKWLLWANDPLAKQHLSYLNDQVMHCPYSHDVRVQTHHCLFCWNGQKKWMPEHMGQKCFQWGFILDKAETHHTLWLCPWQ
jgi:hypothetical protein